MSRISLQQLKSFLLAPTLFLLPLPLLTPNLADAAVQIKNTNYQIPNNAYFVSPNGRNNNSGKSPRSPLTVERAIAIARPGSTIVFRGGVYRGVDVKITKKLTLQAYPHEEPLLKGSTIVKGWVADGRTWRKDGWKYSFPQNMKDVYIDRKHPLAGHRDMVYVNGNSLRQVGRRDRVSPGTFYVDARNNKLYIGSNPAGKTVEATTRDGAFDLTTNRRSHPSGTVIRGLGFAHYAEDAVGLLKTSHVTLDNNTFVWNGLRGVHFQQSSNGVVRGNTFSFNGMHGIRGSWANSMVLEGNMFSYNNQEHFRKDYTAAGIKVLQTDGLVSRNNVFEHNIGNGLWFDASSSNATVKNNTFRNNEQIGIMFELSHNAIASGNRISGSPAGIMIADSSSIQVHNNTFSRNNKHVVIKDSKRRNRDRAEIRRGIAWITRNNTVRNNRMSR
ncbi:MAG: right-handed parallel beta-helix repeat-containing protein [Gloeocapsa sp. UFS-A4-WI-NPMV-4B04]|jgi:parallel beta-helix repeat protein|nr:right-handed parallel beta-helix repeat-containing protein [Gloeocapsa sp. UFS-A4-WI-NPMV-4B04]